MQNIKSLSCVILIGTAWALVGCSSRSKDEVEWARAALARNPNIEIVSVDAAKREFVVKDRGTGAVRTVRMDEIAAIPPAAPATEVATASTAPAAVVDETSTIAEGEPARAIEEAAATTPEAASVVSESEAEATVATPATKASGKLVATGPGYSITRSASTAAARAEPTPARPVATEPVRSEPIICQGARFMRIDGRTLQSTSNAIVAENGCDLHITNANVRADGIALIVRDARVHITNSTLSGNSASFEATGTAELFITGSTFNGITRRFDAAVVNDLGGNQFR